MDTRIALAKKKINEEVKRYTRFGEEAVQDNASLVRIIKGNSAWRFSTRISNDRTSETKGNLPYRATVVSGSQELDKLAGQAEKRIYDEMPVRLETWLRANERNDRMLSETDCFGGTKTFGYEYECSTCHAEGKETCPDCNGRGINDCSGCGRKGHLPCTKCVGGFFTSKPTGKIDCRACRGKGKKDGQSCPACHGSGKVVCSSCFGNLTVKHKACDGRGILDCKRCRTTGKIVCRKCDGSRYFHVLRTVDCKVSSNWAVTLRDGKQEIVQELTGRDLTKLRLLAHVTQQQPIIEHNGITRKYDFECKITEVVINVAGEKKEIIGYSDRVEIFDYKNIIPALLREDSAALTKAVATTPLRLWGQPRDLVNKTKLFFKSPVNINIDNPSYLQKRLIDKKYVERVKSNVSAALNRIVAADIGVAFIVTAGLPVGLFLISYLAGLWEIIGPGVAVAPILSAVVSWTVLERKVYHRLSETFKEIGQKNLDSLLAKYYVLWKFRGAAFLMTLVLLTTLSFATGALSTSETSSSVINDFVKPSEPVKQSSFNSDADRAEPLVNVESSDSREESVAMSNISPNEPSNDLPEWTHIVDTQDDSGLHIRRDENARSESIFHIPENGKVTVLSSGKNRKTSWVRVRYEGYEGWANGKYLHRENAQNRPVSNDNKNTNVPENYRYFIDTRDNSGLYLKEEKDLESESTTYVNENTEVKFIYWDDDYVIINGREGRWGKVEHNGTEGWAWGWYLRKELR